MPGRTSTFPVHAARTRRVRGREAPRAFTLLEAMMALIIIALGVLAFVDAQSAFTRSNTWSSQAATGMLLANEIREMTRKLPRHDPVSGLTLVGNGNAAVLHGWGRETGEVAVDDIDDLDDLDGLTFGAGGAFSGPVDAFGGVVPEIDLQGNIRESDDGVLPLQGWSQVVMVDKVDLYNFNLTRDDAYVQAASQSLPAVGVDRFPLRVTVRVMYVPLGDTQVQEITKLTWIVPP